MLIQRRLECLTVSHKLAGRGLPSAAQDPSTFSAVARQIMRDEGVRGFFKGYSCYMIAIVFWMSCLPMLTDTLMAAVPYLTNRSHEQALYDLSGSRGHQKAN